MTTPLVVIDADALGRRRTGDETYVSNLLRELGARNDGIRIAAVTRRTDLVPAGIEPIELSARSQILRMSRGLPRLLRRVQPALAHFQYAVPPRFQGRCTVTIHDLSFERDATLMGRRDRLIFRTMVPRAARRAELVLTVSERTKRDLIERYELPEEKIRVTPNGVGSSFRPEGPSERGKPYVLFVGALHSRKNPTAAVEALALLDGDLRLLVVGPDRGGESKLRRAIARHGLESRVDLLGYVDEERLAALYRGARCLVFPSRYEGFGLPILEAMASGTPVVATRTSAIPEVAGDAGVLVHAGSSRALAEGIEHALADRDRLAAAGIEHARRFTWAETARRTLAVYHELL